MRRHGSRPQARSHLASHATVTVEDELELHVELASENVPSSESSLSGRVELEGRSEAGLATLQSTVLPDL